MQNLDLRDMWFKQNGATCHTARVTVDLLRGESGEHIISRSWPPRSIDLTRLDNFLWGYVKDHIYTDKPASIDALEDNIEALFVRYRPKCWKEYAKIELNECTIWGGVTVNICMQ